MNEVVLVTTYRRPELLHCCLKRIREAEPSIPISVFPDRGTLYDAELQEVIKAFPGNIQWNLVPDHDYYGNSYNVMEAFRWAYNEGYDVVYYVEDDVMCHPDFFTWHCEQHEEVPDLFGSMGWIFNRHAPISDDVLYAPWYYAIGTCFLRAKLEKIACHATPKYYEDMPGYITQEFADCSLNRERLQFGIEHYEQDGLIQRVLERDKSTCASPGIAKCSHVGFAGYNRGWNGYAEFFNEKSQMNFAERIARLEEFIADPYARAEIFGRDIVEREIGYELPRRILDYTVKLPGGWESSFTSERLLTERNRPAKVNSVRVTPEMVIEKTVDTLRNKPLP